jgi:hypothetical protein
MVKWSKPASMYYWHLSGGAKENFRTCRAKFKIFKTVQKKIQKLQNLQY